MAKTDDPARMLFDAGKRGKDKEVYFSSILLIKSLNIFV